MPDKLGEMLAVATAIPALAAAVVFWLRFATREVKGPVGAAVKTASTGLLAVLGLALAVALSPGGWFWLFALGLALGALGDLMLALGGLRRFLAGVAAFGLGHLAYAGGFLWQGAALGFDGLSLPEGLALGGLLALLASTEVWLAPRTGELRAPVRGYVGLIGLMGAATLMLPAHPGQGILRIGAALFLLSDLLLALQLFVVRDAGWRRRLALTLWPAYWAGQALILWGAVQFAGVG
ncbi:lysoplasmalogenase family protein [Rhodobacter calidifons]|uniref:Lysoplasmalogenase n=1 Tax=Rhodobacter calidifons TaxID=2715277 RepID=A0ABX0G655_9RHOB|nr:lysoplasmalogenase family protein [Rhodobacter calidifons]NHB76691.1 lysoplasmalogenase [Rhodobacter calidifons]